MIVSELREGRVDTLLKLYPWIVDLVRQSAPPPNTHELERQIADLTNLIIQQSGSSTSPVDQLHMKPLGVIQQIVGTKRKLELPQLDEDDSGITLTVKRSTNSDASVNLFNALLGLQQ
jgi:hypothetical protein